ncbi:hypothetical protein L9F63_002266, partial [Diploptera punctata]
MISNDAEIRNSRYQTDLPASSNRRIDVPELPLQPQVKFKNVLSREINVPELPMQAKPKKGKTPPRQHVYATSNLPNKSTHAPSPGLASIKVAYRSGNNNFDESDSDADVVVEEEKEYDMSAGNAAFSMMNIPYQVPAQFMTPVVPLQTRSQRKLNLRAQSSRTSMKAAMTKLPTIKPPTNITKPALNISKSGAISSNNLLQQKPVKVLTVVEKVHKYIEEGTRIMILMRGAPGSGKSFLAKHIIEHSMGKKTDYSKHVFSTDDYFVLLGRFMPKMLSAAHEWNKKRVCAAVEHKLSPIFVDNTNTEVWEMEPYAVLAVQHGYILELLEPFTPWRYQESKLVRKNIHEVPLQQIKNMLSRFERNLTGPKLIAKLRLKYSPNNKPPQPAANSPTKCKEKRKKKPPQPESDSAGAAALVTPVSSKPKKRTRRRKRSKNLAQSDQVPEQSNTIKSDAQQPDDIKKMMDTLALIAKQHAEKNRELHSAGISSAELKNRTSIKDILFSPEMSILPIEMQNTSRMLSNKDLENSFSEGRGKEEEDYDDDNEVDDSDDDDEEDEKEEDEEEEEETDSCMAKVPEWMMSDEDWEYQSDVSEESDMKINEENELSKNSQQCMEYILISDNSEWIYQKDHSNEKQSNEENLIDLSKLQEQKMFIPQAVSEISYCSTKFGVATELEKQNISVPEKFRTTDVTIKISSELLSGDIVNESQEKEHVNSVLPNATRSQEQDLDVIHQQATDEYDFQSDNEIQIDEANGIGINEETKNSGDISLPQRERQIDNEIQIDEANGIGELCANVKNEYKKLENAREFGVATELEKQNISVPEKFRTTDVTIKISSELLSGDIVNESQEKEHVNSVLPNATRSQEQDLDVIHQQATDEDDFQSAVSSETSDDKDKKEQKLEKVPITTKPLPTYDLLSWVMKCNDKEVTADEWEQNTVKDMKKSESSLEPRPARDQRSPRKNLKPIRQIPEKEETEMSVPPECASWTTVTEPTVTWENLIMKTEDNVKDSLKNQVEPQPQRSLFASAETNSSARLLTPDDFIQANIPESENTFELLDTSKSKEKVDNSSNTNHWDFALVSDINKNEDMVEFVEGLKVLTAHSLNINNDTVSSKTVNQHIPLKLMLDKGSMTSDEDDIAMALLVSAREMDAAKKQDFEQLVTMFPFVSQDDLMELFEKCNCNLNWAIDLLLESKLEDYEPLVLPVAQNKTIKLGDVRKNEEKTSLKENIPVFETEIDETAKKLWHEEVKRYIEENIDLGMCSKKNQRSNIQHTLRIKKMRRGEMMDMGEVTTKPIEYFPDSNQNISENILGAIGSEQLEDRAQFEGGAQMTEQFENEAVAAEHEEEEMIPAQLGIGFINQLSEKFGNLIPVYPEDVPSVVNIPLSLARQIHFYIIESQLRVLENQQKQTAKMMQEDEELARKLQEQEHNAKVPNFQEIMDMELALAECRSYQNDEKVSKEDFATKIKKQKLFEMFPELDRGALMSVFEINGYCFDQTVNTVLATMGEEGETVKTVWAPEAFKRLKEEVEPRNKIEETAAVAANKLNKEAFEQADSKAASMILVANELNHDSFTLDLHNLRVSEALHSLDVFLDMHIAMMDPEHNEYVFLITGRGIHSKDGKSRIRPAVEKRLAQRKIKWWPENPGFLRVAISGSTMMSSAVKK